jgi:allantoate deiminase
MLLRRDPMPAAALAITELHRACRSHARTHALTAWLSGPLRALLRLERWLPGFLTRWNRVPSKTQPRKPGAWRHFARVLRVPHDPFLVCTVGSIDVWPGASNVIPGHVNFTVDVRSESDALRERVVGAARAAVAAACGGLECRVLKTHSAPGVACSQAHTERLVAAARAVTGAQRSGAEALRDQGGRNACAASDVAQSAGVDGTGADTGARCTQREASKAPSNVRAAQLVGATGQVPTLPSGAGHDAMALAQATDIAMLFVRCKGGISHSPQESVQPEDVAFATRVLTVYLAETVL